MDRKVMKIYRVLEMPHGYQGKTIGLYYEETAYIKKDLPIPIQIVVLFHEVGHHIYDKITGFLFRVGVPFKIISCLIKLWVLFFERKDELICRRWIPKNFWANIRSIGSPLKKLNVCSIE